MTSEPVGRRFSMDRPDDPRIDPLYVGIDGGGTGLRVIVTDARLAILADANGEGVNPGAVGRITASERIRVGILQVLRSLSADQRSRVRAVGIGVAGAAAALSADWLRQVVGGVLPDAVVVPSSDMEIALVGAHGARRGILLLAGTGSVALGINAAGESAQAGGWGYLIGDEGSGYWIGAQALAAITRAADGRGEPTALTDAVLHHLGLNAPADLIRWLYGDDKPVAQVAALAPLVLASSETDPAADRIVNEAAEALAGLVRAVQTRARADFPIAFAGGLLRDPNPLSRAVCARLHLAPFPTAQYPPQVGAALLAKLATGGASC